jgi:YHS domain-containing protein
MVARVMLIPSYTPGEYQRRKESAPVAIEIDPVCGMEVDSATSQLSFEHDGVTYWFCGKGCLLEFRDDPAKYLDPGYEASM